jgi:hypothetical protein
MPGTKQEGRSVRLSRQELRQLLLDAGRELLLDEGLGMGVEGLTFKRVFDRIEAASGLRLTNGSVIGRIWDGQADFQTDVLSLVAADGGQTWFDGIVESVAGYALELDVSTLEARSEALRQLCRTFGSVAMDLLLGSPETTVWIGVWALATTTEPADQRGRIRESLLEGYRAATLVWEETLAGLLAVVGYRPRHPLTLRQFTLALGAQAEGCSMRQRIDDGMAGFTLPTGPGGADEEWTVFGIAAEALARAFFEPDPDWVPPA